MILPHGNSFRRWFPGLVLITGLGLTFFATYYAARSFQLRSVATFHLKAEQSRGRVEARLEAYIALLRSGAAFLSADPDINAAGFAEYVERLRLEHRYPGIRGIGFTARVPANDRDRLVAWAQNRGVSGFRIWPDQPRDEYHAIVFLEPQDRRNQAAIGYDMFTDPTRRAAMERARDTGEPAVSERVTLVQEIESEKQPGFLIYVPVFSGDDLPETVAERRETLTGFVYSPFRAGDLFEALLGIETPDGINVEIYDGTRTDAEALYYRARTDSKGEIGLMPGYEETRPMHISGHTWTLRFSGKPHRDASWWAIPSLFVGGIALTVVLFRLTQVEAKAEDDLRLAEERLRNYTAELERRVAERTAHLQQSVQSLEGVLYHVAHDLRAPLRSMASFTQLLLEDYAPAFDSRGRDYAGRISSSARRMDELVQDLLAYGRLAHMPVPLDLIPLENELDSVLRQLGPEIKARHATVEVERPLPWVKANSTVLNEVITQLLSNALKFVPPKTAPTIRIRARNGDTVRLWIEDNGIGIPAKFHSRIFRIFEQLNGGGDYSGTGIGLALVHKGVERMGGSVGVESEPGKGCRFWIELPAE